MVEPGGTADRNSAAPPFVCTFPGGGKTGNLVIKRQQGQSVVIGCARVTVTAIGAGFVKLAIEADPRVQIMRTELEGSAATKGTKNTKGDGAIVGEKKISSSFVPFVAFVATLLFLSITPISAAVAAGGGDAWLADMASRLVPPLISGLVLLAGNVLYLRWRMTDVDGKLARLGEGIRIVHDEVAESDRLRLVCKVESAETYAPKAEVADAMTRVEGRFDRVDEKLSDVHSRITGVAREISEMRGRDSRDGPLT